MLPTFLWLWSPHCTAMQCIVLCWCWELRTTGSSWPSPLLMQMRTWNREYCQVLGQCWDISNNSLTLGRIAMIYAKVPTQVQSTYDRCRQSHCSGHQKISNALNACHKKDPMHIEHPFQKRVIESLLRSYDLLWNMASHVQTFVSLTPRSLFVIYNRVSLLLKASTTRKL